jgi:hypothetical protein
MQKFSQIPVEFNDGVYIREVLQSRQEAYCIIPSDEALPSDLVTQRPLHYVATFARSPSLGLVLAEADSEWTTSTDDEVEMDDESGKKAWDVGAKNSIPGEVFVRDIVPNGQADLMGIFQIGDRLQGVGELPINYGGFERAVELVSQIIGLYNKTL